MEASESSGVSLSQAPTIRAPGRLSRCLYVAFRSSVRKVPTKESLFEPVFTKPLWSTVRFTSVHGTLGLLGAGMHLPAFPPRHRELRELSI